jgi:hypothetical protein
MGSSKDTRIVESIVLLGVVNGFLYSLKFNPVNVFMNEVTAGASTLITDLAPENMSGVLLLLLQLLPAILLVISVIYVFRLGGTTAITAVAFGFGCGYFVLSSTILGLICLAVGLLLGLYSVKSSKLQLRKHK